MPSVLLPGRILGSGNSGGGGTTPFPGDDILMETGDHLLQEAGDAILLDP